MKSYTDLAQSRTLAKILPVESADMFYVYDRHLDRFYGDTPYVGYRVLNIDVDMPCWSLAASLVKYLVSIGNFFWMLNGIFTHNTPLIVSNAFCLLVMVYEIFKPKKGGNNDN